MKTFATRKSLFGMVSAAALSLLLVGPAMAQDGTTVTVSGTPLDITVPEIADFAAMEITGQIQSPTAALDEYTVTDFSGTGDGWAVTADATQFTGTGGTLDAGSLSLSAASVTPAAGTTSANPSIPVGGVIDDGDLVISTADVDTGMGEYVFGATTATLTLPSDVRAGNYSSTVTLTASVPVV